MAKTNNELLDCYNSNRDFRTYVDKYRVKCDLSVEEALKEALVVEVYVNFYKTI